MKFIFLFLIIFSSTTYAGSITVRGVSDISQSPDFYKVHITVRTKCFETAKSSNQKILALSQGISEIIKSNISENDEIFITTGLTTRKREVTVSFDRETSRNHTKILCEKGWSSSRKVEIHFENLQIWNELNPQLLFHLDSLSEDNDSIVKEFIETTISSITPQLYPKTIKSMKQIALKEALIDASDQFQMITLLCNLINPKITHISEVRNEFRFNSKPFSTAEGFENLNYQDLKIKMSWNIKWDFDSTGPYCSQIELL